MPDNLAVSVKGLRKSFKNVRALEDVSFSAEKGSIFALLGSNGAGKTTAIKILTTLLRPDSGSAVICGRDVLKQPRAVREIVSLTGQYAAVDEALTGRENLIMIGRLRHLDGVKAKAGELLARFGLAEAADRRALTYSGGMRRRLDLAMSLLGSPEVVFLDEPTTGLDPQARAEMWKIIKELTNSGVTVFLTTQYLEEADRLADYIAILHKGVIAAEGTPARLKKLLPQGRVELRFNEEKDLAAAEKLLAGYFANGDKENLALNVATDGSVKQMMSIFSALEGAGVSISEFTQKSPTLDDVFISIVKEEAE